MTRTLLSRNIHFQTMLFFLPALVLLLTLVVGPVLIALSFAFTNLQLTGAAALNTKFIGGANFSRALADPRFYNALI
ncbi:MAG: hypothetical protein ACRC5H_09355, partial [Treponemataceae bacterium]